MVAHSALTGAELHEPKGVAAATAKTVYVADGAGSGSWTTLNYQTVPSGSLIGFANAVVTSQITGSTILPFDDTIPQNTEGFEVITCSYTPKASGNKLLISAKTHMHTDNVGANYIISGALFKDSDASALAAISMLTLSDSGVGGLLSLDHVFTTTGTSSITFKLRVGAQAAINVYVNGLDLGGGRVFGGVSSTTMTIQEIKA